ncbi:MAG TPA: VWA domain-containing protein [Blastocatellia bacterium]|nr:VWA domain-containing protein [Blastocatellia bacterium]
MDHRAPGNLSPTLSLIKFFCALIAATLALGSIVTTSRSVDAGQSTGELRLELPANGGIRIENLRGSVIARVWKASYVSVAAVGDSGEARSMPAVVDRGETFLSIRLARAPKGAARINLELNIPERAHLAIVTSDGPVDVRGLPAALLAQSVSGEIHIELPKNAEATVVADSRTGSVTSSISSLEVNRSSPQVRGRIGRGGSSVRAYSQAGNISLTSAASSSARVVSTVPERTIPLNQRVNQPTPKQRPQLPVPTPTVGAGTPAPVSPGPEEISEGDVIRVDTELVSVNVSVVDRGTNKGVNDLTKDDFRLYEDNAQQQIVHFESASAPFNLMLLIDLSGSTAKVVELIKTAAIHFVEAARPFDRIAVVTFAGGQVVASQLTSDHEALRRRISAIQRPEGSTRLYDSVVFAVDEVFREAKDSRRNAIVVISDGLDSVMPNVTGEGSTTTYQEMLRRVKEFDGVLYSIWTDTQDYEPLSQYDIQQETFDLAHDQMKELADAGGGAFYECEKLSDLAGAYDRVVADLGTLYTLSYRPTNKVRDGSWRAIRVNVNRANTVARGKRGYFAK